MTQQQQQQQQQFAQTMDHQNLTLPDGRTLEYVVSGSQNDDAFTLLCFHGTVGSSIPNAQMSAACAQRNIRLITPSRPGYGGSTRHAGRKVVDVVADMEALLGDLGAERCVVVGHSGGGEFVLPLPLRGVGNGYICINGTDANVGNGVF